MNMMIYIFTHFIILISFMMIPRISRKDVEFGVNIPVSAKEDPAIVKIRAQFFKLSMATGALIFIAQVFISGSENAFLTLLFTSICVYLMVYINAYNQMKSLKSRMNWNKANNKVVIDTGFRSRRLIVSPKWYLVYLLIVLITVGTAIYQYNNLPEMLNMQLNTSAGNTVLMEKGKALSYLVGVQVCVMGLMIFVQKIIKNAKQSLSSEHVQASIDANTSFRYTISVILYILGLAVGLSMYLSLLFTIGIIKNMTLVITLTLVLTLVPTIILLGVSMRLGQDGSRMFESGSNALENDEDDLWKLGMFYYNPKDPTVFIGKRVGLGWTVNFARWQSWMMICVLVLFVIATLWFV